MSIPVRVPSASEDQPRWGVLAVIATVCAAAGIALAWWGTYDRHQADEVVSTGEATGVGDESATDTAAGDDTATGTGSGAGTGAGAGAGAGSGSGTGTGTGIGTGTATGSGTASAAATGTASETASASEMATATGTPAATAAAAARTTTTPAAPASAPAIASARRGALRVVRGRVAYLRCEGVPQRPGPVPCPRDEALEGSAWSAIDGLASCASLPSRAGEADVVADFAASGAAPEVRARDTFASDVERLDATAVIACLAPTLGAVRQTMGSSRLVVSFRFAVRER